MSLNKFTILSLVTAIGFAFGTDLLVDAGWRAPAVLAGIFCALFVLVFAGCLIATIQPDNKDRDLW